MDCLAAVNRVSDLIRTNKLDSNFKMKIIAKNASLAYHKL
jgi:hypothetical protein